MSSSEVQSDSSRAENDVSVTEVLSLTALPTPKLPSKFKTFYKKSGTPIPINPHLRLTREEVKDYIVIIGDVHGCADELEELISQAPQNSNFICVGDLVKKGPKSRRCVEIVHEKGLTVRGNHEDHLIAAYYRLGKYKVLEKISLNDTVIQMKSGIDGGKQQSNLGC